MKVEQFEKMSIRKTRSAWSRGVAKYATEMQQQIIALAKLLKCEITQDNLKALALNGARSWQEYSYGGSSLIFDGEIAKRLCTPGELKRTGYGRLRPSVRENWLDVQARALTQAYRLLSLEFSKKEVRDL